MLYCNSHPHLPMPKTGLIPVHPGNDGLFTANHPDLVRYCATQAKNTKKPKPRSIPSPFYQEVGVFDPSLASLEDVHHLRHFSLLLKMKVNLLQRMLQCRNDWSKK